MDRLMLDEIIAQPKVAGMGGRQTQVAQPGRVRFWKPASEVTHEFDCAYLDGGSASPHIHEDWQFAVAAAPCAISIGAFRRYIARPDEITVVHPYDAHTEHGMLGEPRQWWILHVGRSLVERVYDGGAGYAPRFDSPLVQDAESACSLSALLQGSLDGSLTGEGFVNQAVEWVRALVNKPTVRRALPAGTNGTGTPIERARAYLQAHATEPLVLADLVGVAGVTTSHFVRSFSRKIGLPPKSYQTQIRLARARRLLAEGKPATWVAYECGFADQSHLSRRFKEFYGLTPGAFQAQYQMPHAVGTQLGWDAA
jgi:AraC-like DNA-binding protein